MSATRYYQVLNALIDKPEALAQDPLLVKRLRRLRATRQRNRSAKRLGIDLDDRLLGRRQLRAAAASRVRRSLSGRTGLLHIAAAGQTRLPLEVVGRRHGRRYAAPTRAGRPRRSGRNGSPAQPELLPGVPLLVLEQSRTGGQQLSQVLPVVITLPIVNAPATGNAACSARRGTGREVRAGPWPGRSRATPRPTTVAEVDQVAERRSHCQGVSGPLGFMEPILLPDPAELGTRPRLAHPGRRLCSLCGQPSQDSDCDVQRLGVPT